MSTPFNSSTPKTSLPRKTRFYTECQSCHKPDLDGSFKKCGGCEVYHYCGKECQKSDWPTHREKCKITRAANEWTKKNGPSMNINGLNGVQAERRLKIWVKTHRLDLQRATVQALNLKANPDNCFINVLYVILKPVFDTHHDFVIAEAHLASLPLLRAISTLQDDRQRSIFDTAFDESLSIRNTGRGIGSALTIVVVPELSSMRLIPHLMVYPIEVDLSFNPAWKTILMASVLM